jgi:hypothetical protein
VPQAFKNNAGGNSILPPFFLNEAGDLAMNQIIYLIGLVVVIMAILSFLGLR